MQDVLRRSLPGMLAWLDLHLRPSPASSTPSAAEHSPVSSCLSLHPNNDPVADPECCQSQPSTNMSICMPQIQRRHKRCQLPSCPHMPEMMLLPLVVCCVVYAIARVPRICFRLCMPPSIRSSSVRSGLSFRGGLQSSRQCPPVCMKRAPCWHWCPIS